MSVSGGFDWLNPPNQSVICVIVPELLHYLLITVAIIDQEHGESFKYCHLINSLSVGVVNKPRMQLYSLKTQPKKGMSFGRVESY